MKIIYNLKLISIKKQQFSGKSDLQIFVQHTHAFYQAFMDPKKLLIAMAYPNFNKLSLRNKFILAFVLSYSVG